MLLEIAVEAPDIFIDLPGIDVVDSRPVVGDGRPVVVGGGIVVVGGGSVQQKTIK